MRRRSSSSRRGSTSDSSGSNPEAPITIPSRLKKGFFERAGERQERLIRRYEEHMAKAARCGDCGKLREAAPDLWAFDDINDPDWYARELAEEEADRTRRREAGEEVSDDEDVVCPGCEAEKRGEKGVPHVGDDFNVPPNKPEEKAANRFDFNKMEQNLRPELKEPLEQLMRDLQIIREQQQLIREDEEKEIEEEQKDWPEDKRAAWRAELKSTGTNTWPSRSGMTPRDASRSCTRRPGRPSTSPTLTASGSS